MAIMAIITGSWDAFHIFHLVAIIAGLWEAFQVMGTARVAIRQIIYIFVEVGA